MVTKYRPHCNIYLTHEYYQDGWSRDFDLTPHGNTLNDLRNQDMLTRKLVRGLSIYYAGSESSPDPIRAIKKTQRWQFALKPRSVYFNTYTELGVPPQTSPGKPFLYFSNYGYDSINGLTLREVDNANNALLSQQPNVGAGDFIGLTPLSFNSNYTPGQHTQITALKLVPGQAPQTIYEANNLSQTSNQHRVNLPYDTQGLHLLIHSGNANTQQLIYVDSLLYQQNTSGLIEIFRQPPVDYQQTVNYYIEFIRRNSPWRFYVLNETYPANDFNHTIEYTGGNAPNPFPANLSLRQSLREI